MRFENLPITQINKNQMMDLEQIQRQKSLSENDFDRCNYACQSRPVCYRRMTEAILIQPHHLSQLCYLNLSEVWYILPTRQTNAPKLSENQIRYNVVRLLRKYVKIRIHEYFYETLEEARHLLPLRFIRSFLCYYRIAELQGVLFPYDTFTCVLFHMHRFHDDSDLMGELLTTVCDIPFMKRLILNTFLEEKYSRYVLKMCNKARFDIGRFLTSDNEDNLVSNPHPFCPVLDCLFLGKIEFLKMFLLHGLEVYDFNARTRFSVYRQYLHNIDELVLQRLPEDSFDDISSKRKFLLLDTFCLVNRHSFPLLLNPQTAYAECASLLFRSVPEPLITQRELVQIISYSNSSEAIAAKMRLTFLKSFKEINAQQYMPRTLKHLCRCTIRKTLSRNFQLPNGIYTLPLPMMLSQYLLLEY